MNAGTTKDAAAVQAKMLRAVEGHLPERQPDDHDPRLPPGQRPVIDRPVLDLGLRPEIALAGWTLGIGGLVERPLVLDWDAFRAMPGATTTADIHCVTGWSRFDNQFSGVLAIEVVAAARPLANAAYVMLRGADGYSTNLAVGDFLSAGAMFAHSWDGESLDVAHGGPVRFVAPHLYFWKSAKWVVSVEFLAVDEPGFWERGGYHHRGDPWLEERYARQDGHVYVRPEREQSPATMADEEGRRALKEVEALETALSGRKGPDKGKSWWRRSSVPWRSS